MGGSITIFPPRGHVLFGDDKGVRKAIILTVVYGYAVAIIHFPSASSFHHFSHEVRRGTRYVGKRSIDQFLEILGSQTRRRKSLVKKGQIFWRGQLGCTEGPHFEDDQYICDVPWPYEPVRMTPLNGRAKEGRANPKGIPYLYCTDQLETAIAEVRPWIGSLVSVGQFRIARSLKLVSCFVFTKPRRILPKGIPPNDWDKAVWWDIDRAFSRPVSLSDDTAEYAPTQIISEYFKEQGYDGLVYRSAFAGGYNLVLFDLSAAELVNCSLYEVKEINLKVKRTGEQYFVSRKSKQ